MPTRRSTIKQTLIIVWLTVCVGGMPGLFQADTSHWLEGAWASSDTKSTLVRHDFMSLGQEPSLIDFGADSAETSLHRLGSAFFPMCSFRVCLQAGRFESIVTLTEPSTLIGHLTLEEFTSLAEVATVTEISVTERRLTVKFFGGGWAGSRLSVFETSFLL